MTLSKLTDYHRPKRLSEAVDLLKENDGYFPIGGGTWLIPYGGKDVKGIIDLSEAGFKDIRLEEDLLHIGGSVTLRELLNSPEISEQSYEYLIRGIRAEGISQLIQAASTIGGRTALARGDSAFLATLAAADASVVIFGNMENELKLWEFISGTEWREERRIISAVEIKNRDQSQPLTFETIRFIPSAPPVISLAVGLEFANNLVESPIIVFSSVNENLVRVTEAESALTGNKLDEKLITEVSEIVRDRIHPDPDPRGTPEYKKEMASVLIKRALRNIIRENG
ncbi:MAG: FAD binding domain-containing protein [Candidatus Marinimicrobia bacterium]|nr:FAD binding domain-containing protein [Candidatus Neomarinimicrobiota bacterium]